MTTPKEPTACGLCGTDPALGHAIVYDDAYPAGQAVHLCHGENQRISCYVKWTVYGTRPADYPSKPKPKSKAVELAEEFRRLAADLKQGLEKAKPPGDSATLYAHGWAAGRVDALEQAAQMLEERLNG